MTPFKEARSLWGTWPGADVLVIGSGTSAAGLDADAARAFKRIALNGAAKLHDADIVLFGDDNLAPQMAKLPLGPGQLVVTREPAARQFQRSGAPFMNRVRVFERASGPRKCHVGDNLLYTSHTIATAGIMLAWKLGAARIFLAGVDAYRLQHSYYADGTRHPRPDKVLDTQGDRVFERRHEFWTTEMRELRDRFGELGVLQGPWPGSGVYNLSTMSRIDAWQKISMEEALRGLQQATPTPSGIS